MSHPATTSAATLAVMAILNCGAPVVAGMARLALADQASDEVRLTLAIDRPHVLADGTELVFREVSDDSRCPTDAQCVWAGDASVVIGVRPASGEPALVTLHIGRQDQRTASAAGVRLTLERLDPQPSSGQPIEWSRYRAVVALGK
jgi:hypothetical protein